jgi:hypothetical protein
MTRFPRLSFRNCGMDELFFRLAVRPTNHFNGSRVEFEVECGIAAYTCGRPSGRCPTAPLRPDLLAVRQPNSSSFLAFPGRYNPLGLLRSFPMIESRSN